MTAKHAQRGITLIEVLGVLAITIVLTLGLNTLIDISLDDVKAQQTGLHQDQAVDAARKYITANYNTLVAATSGGATGTITVAQLKTAGFLSSEFSVTNVFGQTPCVLVRQPASGKLDALVATYGGRAIPERDLRMAAMHAGQGGGYISTQAPGTARGTAWAMVTTAFRNVPCSGTTVLTGAATNDGGHLVSALFYDGPDQLSTDFMRRSAVAGQPALNQMNAPIHLKPGTKAQAIEEDATDPRCATTSDTGKIAVSASGRLLTCQSGVWKSQGSGTWRDPVSSYADLPASGNNVGDVRMVTALGRGFTWTGSAWAPLAADQNNNLVVSGTTTAGSVKLGKTVVRNTACSENGTIARDADGMTLSCQSGKWRNPLDYRLTNVAYEDEWTVSGGSGKKNAHKLINLKTLPGSRPLYLTGYALCHASSFMRAYAYVNMVDSGGPSYIAGGCLSRPDSDVPGVLNKGIFGLQEIPENVSHLLLHLEMEPGAPDEDYVNLVVKIYNSE
jgi:hypothetical protein